MCCRVWGSHHGGSYYYCYIQSRRRFWCKLFIIVYYRPALVNKGPRVLPLPKSWYKYGVATDIILKCKIIISIYIKQRVNICCCLHHTEKTCLLNVFWHAASMFFVAKKIYNFLIEKKGKWVCVWQVNHSFLPCGFEPILVGIVCETLFAMRCERGESVQWVYQSQLSMSRPVVVLSFSGSVITSCT